MKINRKEKNKHITVITISVITYFITACFITLIINIQKNIGVLPLIFILLTVYSFLLFFYNLIYNKLLVGTRKVLNFKLSYFLMFLSCIALFMLSFVVLWI